MTDAEATDFLFIEDEDQAGDVALVFGIKDWREPLAKAVDLYTKGQVPRLIFSGGINKVSGEPEAESMYQEALSRGVSSRDILVENRATNTLENVLYSKELIEVAIGWDKIQVVCGVMANLHARRAMMTMRKHFPAHVRLKACPYVYSPVGATKDNWFADPEKRRWVISEADKIKLYLAKGDIAEL